MQSVTSGAAKTIIEGGSDARYLPTGHLVYGVDGSLFAVPFDVRRLEVTGARVPVVDDVRWSGGRTTGAYHFSLSGTGTLIYTPGFAATARQPWDIALIDRKGVVERLKIPPGRYLSPPRVSPDGERIAFGTDDGREAIIYTYELSGASTIQRLTFGGTTAFRSGPRTAIASYFSRIATATSASGGPDRGTAERLTKPEPGVSHAPESWSPISEILLFSATKGSDVSLWTISPQDRKPMPFGDVHSSYPTGARFSPDGRWVAYAARDRGPTKIYVQPFPATGKQYELFVKGANASPHKVAWSADGEELFYVPRIFEFEAVSVTKKPSFAFGNAVRVPRPFQPGGPSLRTLYDVAPNGKFVGLVAPGGTTPPAGAAPPIQVVLNWFEELRARVPSAN